MALSVQVKCITIAKGKTTEMRYIQIESHNSDCVLVLPAMGVPAAYYDRLLKSLAKEGWNCGIIDFQGQGKSSVIPCRKENYGYKELLSEDIPAAVTELSDLFKKDVLILGHSLGGQLATLYSGLQDDRISGLILCTCCSVYWKMWPLKEQLKVLFKTQSASIYAFIKGYFPGEKFGFGGRNFQRLIGDWARQARTGRYSIKGSNLNWEKQLKEVSIPVLSIYLKEDFLAPPKAVNHLCKKLAAASIALKCINDNSLNHFNWLRKPAVFIDLIKSWDADIKNPNTSIMS